MSTINDQITDSVNQVNTLLMGSAPMQSMGMLNVTASETIGMSMFNAVSAQQNAQTSASAAAAASCAKMLQQSPPPPTKKPTPEVKPDLTQIEALVKELLEKHDGPQTPGK
ncbi:RebB family R body protein [Pseudoalteromonas sp. OOF1S-7]|uniref:RebB family R body protein n=1 Tax=Pseudoalteromonas sp. OOF1S-7 TaxID=2917757 RepID=UPI001EF4E140|nr:RebB family R body protein [Pseudoalteromonas sp. OOF1S-7]MCG7534138.1 RebB family R body protein [Pseudoalteromonas sp. OOF1S-7]